MSFSAKDVQELRKATGAGMMDAKKALVETDGDFEAAGQLLREKGLAKAMTRSDRDNVEGLIAVAQSDSGASLVHLKSETDFAAKSDDFRALVQSMADTVLVEGADALSRFESNIEDLKLTIKENIEIGTVAHFPTVEGRKIDAYIHGGGTAGVLVEATGVDDELLHEIALNVAFAKPSFLNREDVPTEEVEKERGALLEITKSEGKPEQVWDKIVEGRVNSWLAERVLTEQGMFGEKEKVSSKIGDGTIHQFVFAQIG
jgi:elongation factor Ts